MYFASRFLAGSAVLGVVGLIVWLGSLAPHFAAGFAGVIGFAVIAFLLGGLILDEDTCDF